MSRNISPKIWGPSGWKFIEAVTKGFDPNVQNPGDLISFVNSLGGVLPCTSCRNNWPQTLAKYPIEPYIESDSLPQWFSLVREEVRKHESKYNSNGFSWGYVVAGAAIVGVIGAIVYNRSTRKTEQ